MLIYTTLQNGPHSRNLLFLIFRYTDDETARLAAILKEKGFESRTALNLLRSLATFLT